VRPAAPQPHPTPRPASKPRTHVFIIDGTLSSTAPGCETHAGALWRLLTEDGPSARQSVGYHPGVQGVGLRRWWRAATGAGLNDAICAGYGWLSSRWRPGDRILLFGYSRGAYAARSLAGLIDRIGLLQRGHAMERRISRAFRHYRAGRSASAQAFSRSFCHLEAPVDAIFAWDTVKALGLPAPGLIRFHPMAYEFHNDDLGHNVRAGFHALAADEDRSAYRPVMWTRAPDWTGRLEQMWFPGAHGDVGGQLDGAAAARPLANLSLVWMLEHARDCGLTLPAGWRARFPTDPCAPMVGARSGIGRFFLRRPRRFNAGEDGQRASPAIAARIAGLPGYHPRALGLEGGPPPVAPPTAGARAAH
jgi:uncharacterized protein (DUF2235 family)